MAVYDLQEQEQIDALKIWWKDNGKWVMGTVIAALLIVAGIQGWRWWQQREAGQAAALFEQLQQELSAPNETKRNALRDQLLNQYGGTAYAARAALLTASAAFGKGALPAAAKDLQWVIDHAKEPPVQDLARLRLAGVYLDQKQYDLGLARLSDIKSKGLAGEAGSLKGDLLLAKGQTAAAREAYRIAAEQLDPADPMRNLIDVKLDALGEQQ